jgi:hypothetical protein
VVQQFHSPGGGLGPAGRTPAGRTGRSETRCPLPAAPRAGPWLTLPQIMAMILHCTLGGLGRAADPADGTARPQNASPTF